MASHFDLIDIRLFVNSAEENNLTRGAERSHMSLPAASTRIKNLEDSLGVKLLIRASHPDVSVDLRERLSHDIVRAVSEGKTDIGIVAGNVRTEGLEVLPYRKDRLILVTPQVRCTNR